jgi:D-alanine-D-alanine ligase
VSHVNGLEFAGVDRFGVLEDMTEKGVAMTRKIRLGILFGGKSAEHEVSLQSAKNIIEAVDREKYDIVLITINKQGQWHLADTSDFLVAPDDPQFIKLAPSDDKLGIVLGDEEHLFIRLKDHTPIGPLDVIFPVLHGPYGEDGTIQGLLKLAHVPFVGASVLGSAVGLDKDVMKHLLEDAGVPIARFVTLNRDVGETPGFQALKDRLGVPLFIKPANLGSSVGVHKVSAEEAFESALRDAFQFDSKILVEEFISGREIECSVLGNENPMASLPGEILPQHEFYSYEAKYLDEKGALLEIPANLPQDVVRAVQNMAIRSFQALCCEGMARVDLFLRGGDEIVINEINTIPGFTRISMYPKLWEASGISYADLIDRLITLAMERHEKEKTLKTSYV